MGKVIGIDTASIGQGSIGQGSIGIAARSEHLTATRHRKMARSQHAYVRGSTVKFYEWLDASAGKIPQGPSVWICGDCHLGNLGPLADAHGHVAIQIRDLDQTVIGNPAHDIIRLTLSLASAARGFDLPGAITARIVEAVIAGYCEAIAGAAVPDADAPDAVKALLKLSTRRKWRHLAKERIGDSTPSIPLGSKYWALSDDEHEALAALLTDPAVVLKLRAWQLKVNESGIALLDAAYWMKGCSSLGQLRYAAIAGVGKPGPQHLGKLCLLDIKEAVRAAAPRDAAADMPRDNAERIVTGATALSPHLGERMIAARLLGKPVVVRELMPQDLKLEIARLTPADTAAVAQYLGGVVGTAHGRQLDVSQRKSWARELTENRSKTLDAPSWLWANVVELVALHEAAYLEHCRRHLAEAA